MQIKHSQLKTGRYLTHDPLGLKGGVNLYNYSKHNPMTYIDKLGLFYEDEDDNYSFLSKTDPLAYSFITASESNYMSTKSSLNNITKEDILTLALSANVAGVCRNVAIKSAPFVKSVFNGLSKTLKPALVKGYDKSVWGLYRYGNGINKGVEFLNGRYGAPGFGNSAVERLGFGTAIYDVIYEKLSE